MEASSIQSENLRSRQKTAQKHLDNAQLHTVALGQRNEILGALAVEIFCGKLRWRDFDCFFGFCGG